MIGWLVWIFIDTRLALLQHTLFALLPIHYLNITYLSSRSGYTWGIAWSHHHIFSSSGKNSYMVLLMLIGLAFMPLTVTLYFARLGLRRVLEHNSRIHFGYNALYVDARSILSPDSFLSLLSISEIIFTILVYTLWTRILFNTPKMW